VLSQAALPFLSAFLAGSVPELLLLLHGSVLPSQPAVEHLHLEGFPKERGSAVPVTLFSGTTCEVGLLMPPVSLL